VTAPWLLLCDEAEACAINIARPTFELERLSKQVRSAVWRETIGVSARSLIRLSLGFCIETEHGRKHACIELAGTARQVRSELPEPQRRWRADIDG
jgi:hypothetical protein